METLQDTYEERLPDSPPSGFDSSSDHERTPSPTPSYHTNIHHHTPRSSTRSRTIRRPPLPVPSAPLSINTSLVGREGNTAVNFPRKAFSESEKLEARIQAMRVVERNRDTFGGGNTDDTGDLLEDGLDEGVPTYEPQDDANLVRGGEARKVEDRKDMSESERGEEVRRREVIYRTHPPSTGGNARQESSYRNVDSWRRGEELVASEHGQIIRSLNQSGREVGVRRSTSMASMGMSSPTSTTRSAGSAGSSMSTSTYGMSSAELAQHHLREAEKHLAAARLISVVEEPQHPRTPHIPPPSNRQTDSARFSIDSYDSRFNGNGTTIDDHTSITGNNGSSWDAASVQDHALVRKRDHWRDSPDLREFEIERSEGDEVDTRYATRPAPPSKPYRHPTPTNAIEPGRTKYDEDYSYYDSNKPLESTSIRSNSNLSNSSSGQMESPSTFPPSLYGGGARGVASQFKQGKSKDLEESKRTIIEEEEGEEEFVQTPTSDHFDPPPHSLPTPPPSSNNRQRLPLPPQQAFNSQSAALIPQPPSIRQQQAQTAPISTMGVDEGIHGFKPRLGPTWAPPSHLQQQLPINGYTQLQGGYYTPAYGPPPQFSANPYQAPQYPQQYPQHNPYSQQQQYQTQQQPHRQTTLPSLVHYPPLQFNHQVPYGGVHQAHVTYATPLDPNSQLLPPSSNHRHAPNMTMEQLSRPGSVRSDKSGSSGNNTFGRGTGGSNDGSVSSTMAPSSFGLRGTMKSLKGKLSSGGVKHFNSRSGLNELGSGPGVVPYVSGSATSLERTMSPHVRFKSPGPEDSQAFPSLSSKGMESLGPEERKLLALKRKKVAGSIESSFGMLM